MRHPGRPTIRSGFDHRHQHPFRIHRPQGGGDWLLLLITTPAEVVVSGRLQGVVPVQALLYGPDDPQDYRSRGVTYRNHWVHFAGGDLPGLVRELGLPTARPWTVADPAAMERPFRELCRESLRQAPHHRRSEAAHLVHLLVAAARDAASGPATARDGALRDLRAEVHSRLAEPWSLAGLARRVGMGPSRFAARYRAAFGASPIDDLIAARIDQASRLLEAGQPPAEVAAQVGFNDLSYFYRQFRRRTGMTPGRCRSG